MALTKVKVIDARGQSPEALSQSAIKSMIKAGVVPTPDNYQVWYHFAREDMPALKKEMDTLRKQEVPFSDDVMFRLHRKYFAKSGGDEQLQTINAAMGKLMTMVGQFSTEADAYNDKLGQQTDDLSSKIEGDAALEDLLGEVVGQLKEIKESGNSFGAKMKESQREITELRQSLEKANTEARVDDLTKVHNRRAFDEAIEEQIKIAEKEHKDLSLLLIDIDHFKQFNDTWGHQIGDEVLKVVAGAMKRTVRGQDIVARYGGEEFAVLLPDTPTNGAHIVAENIRKLIANNRLRRKGQTEDMGQITISVGVTRYRLGDKDENIPFFIKRADDALYSAKDNGRNRVAIEL